MENIDTINRSTLCSHDVYPPLTSTPVRDSGSYIDDAFTVRISSSLISRLVGDDNKPKKKPKQIKPQPQHQINDSASHSERMIPNKVWPLQPPVYLPPPPSPATPSVYSELESIKSVIQDSERTLERLQKQEDSKVQELTERAKELHKKEFKLPYRKPKCTDELSACHKCYEENLKNPLKCADFVQRYVNCCNQSQVRTSSASE